MSGVNRQKSKKSTLKESAYESLKAMILTGELQPGSRLTEIDLANRLKVSRTPLREALNRLERDEFVTNRPRQGYFVAEFDLKKLEDTLEIREILDGHAAKQAAARIESADKERLWSIIRQCDEMARMHDPSLEHMIEEMRLGLDVHRIIAEVSGNDLLSDMISKILDKVQHFIWIELLWLDEWHSARDEHKAIVEAVCSGNGAHAMELARNHVRGSKQNILRFMRAKTAYQSSLARAS